MAAMRRLAGSHVRRVCAGGASSVTNARPQTIVGANRGRWGTIGGESLLRRADASGAVRRAGSTLRSTRVLMAGNPDRQAAAEAALAGGALNQLYLRCLEPATGRKNVPLDDEELERGAELAKAYTRGMMARHKAREKDMNRKIRLKWQAIAALPSEALQREALHVSEDPDELLPPMHRRVPTHFPPTLTQDESGGGHIATRSLGGASADA